MPSSRAILVHDLSEARTALAIASELGVAVTLISDAAATASGGVGWFVAMINRAISDHPELTVTVILDCGDRAGDAQAALAIGVRALLYTGPEAVTHRLSDIAADRDAVILTLRPETLDLRGRRDPALLCRAWLKNMAVPEP